MTTINLGKVVGDDGEDGRGIVSIEKTGTEGLVDTYTITYTDGTTSTYTVTNGSGGGGGTANYNELENKPSINNVSLQGNKSLSDLGVQPAGDYALSSEIPDISTKQDTLVSGTNIKTVNNQSLLGSGNINIEGGGSSSGISTDDSNSPFEIADENGNAILKIDSSGNINTMNFSSEDVKQLPSTNIPGKLLTSTSVGGTVEWKDAPSGLPKTNLAGKVLTSTNVEGSVKWEDVSNVKTLKVPFIKDQHRGYSSTTVAENTLPAFKRAWLNGADMIELDARLSADNVYICCHDTSVTVGGTTYVIADTNASVLTNLVLSTDGVYGDCKIPLTETVLKFCAHAGMICNLDCKSIDTQTIAELVNKCGMSGKVLYANVAPNAALTILNYDKNAAFLFAYDNLSTWVTAFENRTDVLEKCWCWANRIVTTAQDIATARSYGVKYLITSISSYNSTVFDLQPDGFEFDASADCQKICDQYLESLNF